MKKETIEKIIAIIIVVAFAFTLYKLNQKYPAPEYVTEEVKAIVIGMEISNSRFGNNYHYIYVKDRDSLTTEIYVTSTDYYNYKLGDTILMNKNYLK